MLGYYQLNITMASKNIKDITKAFGGLAKIDAFQFWSIDDIDPISLSALKKLKKRHWLYIVYPESAPLDWIEQFKMTGIQFAVSPLHDKDVDITGNIKKPHWHVIVIFDGPTTFITASSYKEITKGPYPKVCENLRGSYEYFIHKNDPDKVQYSASDIQEFNGFHLDLSASDTLLIKKELAGIIISEDIKEYMEFDLFVRSFYDNDYYSVASNNTMYFNALIKSYHHNPETIKKRIEIINNKLFKLENENNLKEEEI